MKLTVLGLLALVLVSLTGPALAAPISGAAVRTADGPPLTLDSIQAPWSLANGPVRPAGPAHRATRASHVVSP